MSDDFDAIVERAQARYRTTNEAVAAAIREGILMAIFRPGERLRLDQLARRMDVSWMPVRAALQQVEAEGLISLHPYRGAIVRELGTDQMRQMYDIRAHLETFAVEKAMTAMTPTRMAELVRLADELDSAEDGDRFARLSIEFYDHLYDPDANPLLVALIQRLRGDVGRYWLQLQLEGGHAAGSHHELLQLVRNRDVAGAQQFVREHIIQAGGRLVERFELAHAREATP